MSTVAPMRRAAVPNRAQARVLRPIGFIGLAMRATDLLVIAAAAAMAGRLTGEDALAGSDPLMLVVTMLMAAIALSSIHLYDLGVANGRRAFRLGPVAAAWLVSLALALALLVLVKPDELPTRPWVVAFGGLGLLGLAGTRVMIGVWLEHLRRTGKLTYDVVVVGSGAWGGDVRRRLEAGAMDSLDVGYLNLGHLDDFGDLESALRQKLTSRPVDLVALALRVEDMHRLPWLLDVLKDFPVEVGLLPQLTDTNVPILGYRRLGDMTTVTCLRKPIDGWSWHVKAAFDRTVAFSLLVFLAPLLVVLGLAVRWTSPGPIFFTQTRLGFNQQPINVFKFRSMYTDRCDTLLAKEVKHATRDDPRVTPLGAVLRRTSLDELPQLFNVLRGDMSLVGPRPHAVAHDEYYANLIDGYLGRHRAKPGITGWAQVNGCRGEIFSLEDMRRRIELDLHYIDNWSLLLDIKILFRTMFVCFRGEQAY